MISDSRLLFSSLVFCSFKKLSVLVLVHLLLAPLYDIPHPFTSLYCNNKCKNSVSGIFLLTLITDTLVIL